MKKINYKENFVKITYPNKRINLSPLIEFKANYILEWNILSF